MTPAVIDREQYLIIPHLFDRTNYAYWKVLIIAFLQSLDEKVWLAIKVGWTKPKEPPTTWDDTKIKAANFNSRALNALFSDVTNEKFKKSSLIDNVKEVWTILQNTYEGTRDVKNFNLQRLTTSFEEIRMDKDELFDEFYAKLKDIVNSTFNLGEQILEPKVVKKILKSLLERFHAKITAIEDSKDLDSIPLTELIGNLQTYELRLARLGKSGKGKNMALKTKNDDNDEDTKLKSYITRQFKKFIKNANVNAGDKDHKQTAFSQYKSQVKGKKRK